MASVREWTDPQKDCIHARGGSVFVSAAAGSGKTAVLIERIITILCDKDEPIDIDRLLVVTYTKAAAAEMRSRLSVRLSEKLAVDPHNRHLLRQQMLLPQANICTIHSFCGQILREYAAQVGISPRFRIADSTVLELLQADVVNNVVQEAYRENSDDFRALCANLTEGIRDNALAAQILRVHGFIQAHPFPLQWLEKQEREFTACRSIDESVWVRIMLDQAREDLTEAYTVFSKTYDEVATEEILKDAYGTSIAASRDATEAALKALDHGWTASVNAVNAIDFPDLKAIKKYPDPEFRVRMKDQRDYGKKIIETVQSYLYQSEDEILPDILAAAPLMRALCALVKAFDRAMTEAKAEQNCLDFNDLEHMTLTLLATPNDDGTFTRTELAKEISTRFTHIMVDEYQDSNPTQDALFSAVSDDEKNLFFVGDIKQSIYGFRKAMPSIFRERRESGTPYDRDNKQFPASITLGNNFRSRSQVTEATNYVFRRLMTKETGDIVYDEREELVASRKFPAADDPAYDTEVLILEPSGYSDEITPVQAEARLIGERILTMIANDFQVTDKDTTRPATYRDFCILLKSVSRNAPVFLKELQAMGIPVSGGGNESFFEGAEVRTALSILRTIDNPMVDVPMLATLMSPVYGFSPDDMAIIRKTYKDIPLYTALRRMASSDHPLSVRIRAFLDDLHRYRTLAASMPADGLIRRLYEDTDMLAVMSAKNGGAARIANLRKLYDLARRFEDSDFKGLASFIRYLDRLGDQKIDIDAAQAESNSQNCVRLMTIHGSKGLEFPVVFVSRISGKFNDQSIIADILMHAEYGIGIRLRDRDAMTTCNPLHHQAIAAAIKRSERTETLRLLYVAMTRAQDKLILTLTPSSSLAKTIGKLVASFPGGASRIPPSVIVRSQNMQKWVLAALLEHPASTVLHSATTDNTALTDSADGLSISIVKLSEGDERPHAPHSIAKETALGNLRERLDYRYPYAVLGEIPAKLTASQAAHDTAATDTIHLAQPAFLSQGGLTPAQRGTATHIFFENVDLTSGISAEEQADAMVENGILTDKQRAVLRYDRLNRFLQSEIAKRMAASALLLREFPFAVERPVASVMDDTVLPAEAHAETVMIQGIADAVFVEDDKLVIVDYKTDRVDSGEELVTRYRKQLAIYRDALSETLQKPVKDTLIYSFHLNDAFTIDG